MSETELDLGYRKLTMRKIGEDTLLALSYNFTEADSAKRFSGYLDICLTKEQAGVVAGWLI